MGKLAQMAAASSLAADGPFEQHTVDSFEIVPREAWETEAKEGSIAADAVSDILSWKPGPEGVRLLNKELKSLEEMKIRHNQAVADAFARTCLLKDVFDMWKLGVEEAVSTRKLEVKGDAFARRSFQKDAFSEWQLKWVARKSVGKHLLT